MIVVVIAGPNARKVGVTIGTNRKKRNKLWVRFPGLDYPHNMRAIDRANMRPATRAEAARIGL